MKICNKCWIEKDKSFFCKKGKWFTWKCKLCLNEIRREKYKDDHKLRKRISWYAKKQLENEDFRNNRIIYKRNYNRKNKKTINTINSIRRENNREKKNKWSSDWAKRNRDKCNVTQRNYEIKKRTTCDWTITLEAINIMLLQQDNKCVLCSCDITDRNKRHLDHIHPLNRWGIHSIINVQWLCCYCNLSKWDRILEWI